MYCTQCHTSYLKSIRGVEVYSGATDIISEVKIYLSSAVISHVYSSNYINNM